MAPSPDQVGAPSALCLELALAWLLSRHWASRGERQALLHEGRLDAHHAAQTAALQAKQEHCHGTRCSMSRSQVGGSEGHNKR